MFALRKHNYFFEYFVDLTKDKSLKIIPYLKYLITFVMMGCHYSEAVQRRKVASYTKLKTRQYEFVQNDACAFIAR